MVVLCVQVNVNEARLGGGGEAIVEGISVVETQGVDGGSIVAGIVNLEIDDAPSYLEVLVRIPLSDVATAPEPYEGPVVENGAAN